jgi:hypothetical protein
MKLRFMKEQRDQLKNETQNTFANRRRTKFNLDDGSEEENMDFFTHKGKKLEDLDDFKDKISNDSGDQYEDRDMQKGIMTNEMVNALNFGGGDLNSWADKENEKKTREQRHAEIMEKSKAYKLHHQEIKEATYAYTKQLDEDFGDMAGLLNFNRKKPEPEA